MCPRREPFMEGDLVDLVWPSRDDFEVVAGMLAGGPAAALATGGEVAPEADDLRADCRSGRTTIACVVTKDGQTIGFVRWVARKYAGSYEIGGLVEQPAQWDLGMGAEGTGLALEHLFHACNAHRVQFLVGAFNLRTLRMVLSLGLPVEGILRDYFFLDGEYHDGIVTSVLREEFYRFDSHGTVRDRISSADKQEARELLVMARARQAESVGL
ncbi:GNAT family N-acetyltransferase [Nocardioides pantholopis]|uniref:GNAT family N-acetyltransferase n=1 Tax=Nocardioides pantholopis TaxID=2483798 RepID=UPI0013DE4007|nr:GNAT family protein [Nocardioides pantholopis]